MTANSHDQLIRSLAADLQPVRRLPPPLFRALAWLGVLVALAVVLAAFASLDTVWQRISAAPDCGSPCRLTFTAVLAAIAAFEPESAGCAARMGAAAVARCLAMGRGERLRLPAGLDRAAKSRCGDERGARLPNVHRIPVGAALGPAAPHVAAGLSALSRACGYDRRAFGRRSCSNAHEFLPSLRRGRDRSCRPCRGCGAGDRGQSPARRTNFRGSGPAGIDVTADRASSN